MKDHTTVYTAHLFDEFESFLAHCEKHELTNRQEIFELWVMRKLAQLQNSSMNLLDRLQTVAPLSVEKSVDESWEKFKP
jgi:hypothetical protein